MNNIAKSEGSDASQREAKNENRGTYSWILEHSDSKRFKKESFHLFWLNQKIMHWMWQMPIDKNIEHGVKRG